MPSARAHLLSFAVRMLRVRRALDGAERIQRSIAADRKNGPATPSAQLRARLSFREEMFDGFDVYTVGPRTGQPRRQVLYLHGGGWARPITDPHWGMIAKLVDLLDCSVTVPMYPLAPEHTARETFAWLLSRYADQASDKNLILMGDSSGGNLALSLAMQARANGLPRPARLVLLSPLLDATGSDPAIAELDRIDPIVPARGLRVLTRMFAGDVDLHDPMVSPLFGTLAGLPPIAVFTGTREILNADAHRLRRKAAQSGFPLSWHEYPGMLHVWPLFPIPEAQHALAEIAAFVTGVGDDKNAGLPSVEAGS
ncbi:alpha/beta hydrolase [Nocardia nepalensis]|uniref:alpha/beta hydrolase n=1 Tax=Nocardia nepalensis TaxID=3375448 RepID=UPI003B678CB5